MLGSSYSSRFDSHRASTNARLQRRTPQTKLSRTRALQQPLERLLEGRERRGSLHIDTIQAHVRAQSQENLSVHLAASHIDGRRRQRVWR